jgi:DNA adenine methylase
VTYTPQEAPKKNKTLLSPFRYPGGKIWLRPFVRQWLSEPVDLLVESFAGGANVALTAVSEDLAKKAIIIEIDPDVASVWDVILNGKATWLSGKIKHFKVSRRTVGAELARNPRTTHTRAWKTILRNRVNHGGILAPGAGLLRRGEDDQGINSRWYANTLIARIEAINKLKRRIKIIEGDCIEWLEGYKQKKNSVAFFIDPPYSSVGERLYTYGTIDHGNLFRVVSSLEGRILMTYHDGPEIRRLAKRFGFSIREVKMINRQHSAKTELLISRNFDWFKDNEKSKTDRT